LITGFRKNNCFNYGSSGMLLKKWWVTIDALYAISYRFWQCSTFQNNHFQNVWLFSHPAGRCQLPLRTTDRPRRVYILEENPIGWKLGEFADTMPIWTVLGCMTRCRRRPADLISGCCLIANWRWTADAKRGWKPPANYLRWSKTRFNFGLPSDWIGCRPYQEPLTRRYVEMPR
jgi:hypothetical protein